MNIWQFLSTVIILFLNNVFRMQIVYNLRNIYDTGHSMASNVFYVKHRCL
jgi:hypothetical protein